MTQPYDPAAFGGKPNIPLSEEALVAQAKAQLVAQNPALALSLDYSPETPLESANERALEQTGESVRVEPEPSMMDIATVEGRAMTQGALSNPARRALEEEEAAGKAQAAGEAGERPVVGVSPEARRQAVLDALGGGQPQVVGYSKGGMMPSGTTQQAQVERKVMPPEWHESLARFTETGRAAAEGLSAEAALVAEARARAASRQARQLEVDARAEQIAQQNEQNARQLAEQRIQAALADFQASGPRPENYGTFFDEATPGGKVGAIFAGLFGAMGGAATGRPSGFTEALDKQIENRARAAEAEQRRMGAVLGAQETAYGRLEKAFASEQQARAAIRAIYYQQAGEELKAELGAIGVGAEHPRAQAMLQELEGKRLGYLSQLASGVIESARADQKFVPPQAIVAKPRGLSGIFANLSKDQMEQLQKFEAELEKRGVLMAEQGVAGMNEGLREMMKNDPQSGRRFLLKLAASRPGSFGEVFAQFSSTPGAQKFLNGYQRFISSDAGKATTATELTNLGNSLGSGSDEALQTAVYGFNRRVQDQYDSLRAAGYDDAYKVYGLVRELVSSERGPRDVQGIPHPAPQTEPFPVAPSREQVLSSYEERGTGKRASGP